MLVFNKNILLAYFLFFRFILNNYFIFSVYAVIVPKCKISETKMTKQKVN